MIGFSIRESARIRINGKEAGTVWAAPFRLKVGKYLQPGKNLIEIEVTNLPANRIAELDRQNVPWRKFKEINFVGLDNYFVTNFFTASFNPLEDAVITTSPPERSERKIAMMNPLCNFFVFPVNNSSVK